MEQIINAYYENNAKKLRNMVDKVLCKLKFRDIDHEDFYSLANEVFTSVLNSYDKEKNFDSFLYSCLDKKFKTEMTRRRRDKRCAKIRIKYTDEFGNKIFRKESMRDICIDALLNDEDNLTVGDTIADTHTIEKELFEEREEGYSKKMLLYLSRLSADQKEILRLTIAGYLPGEIREELHMTEKQYCDNYAAIHSYRNVSILF